VAIADRTDLLVIIAKAANTDNIATAVALRTLVNLTATTHRTRVAALTQLQVKTPFLSGLLVNSGNQIPAGNSLPL
jgi:hypothetical protein